MLKIRRPLGRLIFNMGIAIPGKTVFLIETAPRRNESARPLHKSPHWIVSLIVLRNATLTFELHVYSGLNTNLWYMLWHTTRIRMIQEGLLWEIIFHLGYWDSTSGINALSETNLLWLCLGNVQCWYSLTYDMKLPSPASHVYIRNFTMEILYYLKSSITRFDMLRKIYNQEIPQF